MCRIPRPCVWAPPATATRRAAFSSAYPYTRPRPHSFTGFSVLAPRSHAQRPKPSRRSQVAAHVRTSARAPPLLGRLLAAKSASSSAITENKMNSSRHNIQ